MPKNDPYCVMNNNNDNTNGQIIGFNDAHDKLVKSSRED